MFKYKQCKNCGIKSKKQHDHCTKCGSPLDNVLKTSIKSLISIIALFLVLSGSATYAYFEYFKNQKTSSTTKTTEQNDTERAVVPWHCPTGTKSPNGGNINWDGSTICVPEGNDKTGINNNISNSKPINDQPSITQVPATSTPAPEPPSDDWYEYCLVDLRSASKYYQDRWDEYYANNLIDQAEAVETTLQNCESSGFGRNSTWCQAHAASTNVTYEQGRESMFQVIRKGLIDATRSYPCGPGKLIHENIFQ